MALRLFPDRRLSDRRFPESTSIPTIALAYTVTPTINSFPDHSIDVYTLSLDSISQIESYHYFLMFGEGVGRGTLYLYELVGETYISMLVGEYSFGKMMVG